MSGDPLRPVGKGEHYLGRLRETDALNPVFEAARAHRLGAGAPPSGGGAGRAAVSPHSTVWVEAHKDMPRGSVVKVAAAAAWRPDTEEAEAAKRPGFLAFDPAADVPFLITLEGALTGDLVPAVVSGAALVRLSTPAGVALAFAEVIPGDSTKLLTVASGGAAVLWSESGGAAERWATVLLGAGAAAGGETNPCLDTSCASCPYGSANAWTFTALQALVGTDLAGDWALAREAAANYACRYHQSKAVSGGNAAWVLRKHDNDPPWRWELRGTRPSLADLVFWFSGWHWVNAPSTAYGTDGAWDCVGANLMLHDAGTGGALLLEGSGAVAGCGCSARCVTTCGACPGGAPWQWAVKGQNFLPVPIGSYYQTVMTQHTLTLEKCYWSGGTGGYATGLGGGSPAVATLRPDTVTAGDWLLIFDRTASPDAYVLTFRFHPVTGTPWKCKGPNTFSFESWLINGVNQNAAYASGGYATALTVHAHEDEGPTPGGPAGGALSGTYPNPGLASDVIVPANINPAGMFTGTVP